MITWRGNEAHHRGAFVGRVMRTHKTADTVPDWMAWTMNPTFASLGAFRTVDEAKAAVEESLRIANTAAEAAE